MNYLKKSIIASLETVIISEITKCNADPNYVNDEVENSIYEDIDSLVTEEDCEYNLHATNTERLQLALEIIRRK